MKQSEVNRLRRTSRGGKSIDGLSIEAARRIEFRKSLIKESRSLDIHNSTDHEISVGFGYVSNELSDCYETVEDHIVPRQSLTDKQNLRNNVRPLMGVVVKGCLVIMKDGKTVNTLDKVNPGKDVRITLMSDKTLLNKGNPFQDKSHFKLKRKPSRGKGFQYPDKVRDVPVDPIRPEISLDLDNDGKNTSYHPPFTRKKT